MTLFCLFVQTGTIEETGDLSPIWVLVFGALSPIWVSVVGAPKILEVWIPFILGGIRNLQNQFGGKAI